MTLMGKVLVKPQTFAVKRQRRFPTLLNQTPDVMLFYGEDDVRFCIFRKMKLDSFFPKISAGLYFLTHY